MELFITFNKIPNYFDKLPCSDLESHNCIGKQSDILSQFENMVKIYKQDVFIEACFDIFLNEIMEYVIMNEEPMPF